MSVYAKLLEVQKEVGAIGKDSTNPFYKSKYFDINKLIEVVSPILSKNGLLLIQPIKDNKVYSKNRYSNNLLQEVYISIITCFTS